MNQDRPGGQKPMNSYVISDLEVCGLEDSKFSEARQAYTHGSIPVHTENIPKQSEIRKWPYLQPSAPARDRSGTSAYLSERTEPQAANAQNRCMAEQRLANLRRKFRKDPGFYEDYKCFMDNVIEKGYAVRVPGRPAEPC
ncbi:hypothetical protein AAFF_G00009950 [Aldrovandia affinis]|uniref:Uncharacterized protein n=1 Tax=Aldrovandia affinis TaxID=143900 RepID=A0AAD7S710_9TELE|nr:hypothetical protein AAFF_G00009950 [Aldrovandia affinis]